MPLYEYHCSKCDKNFEVLQKFSDAPVVTHEDCGGTVERVLSAPAFQLKGSGWYVTDYGKGGNRPGTLSDHAAHEKKSGDSKTGDSDKKPAEAKSESKPAETKSEAKTEAKTESKPAESKPAAKAD